MCSKIHLYFEPQICIGMPNIFILLQALCKSQTDTLIILHDSRGDLWMKIWKHCCVNLSNSKTFHSIWKDLLINFLSFFLLLAYLAMKHLTVFFLLLLKVNFCFLFFCFFSQNTLNMVSFASTIPSSSPPPSTFRSPSYLSLHKNKTSKSIILK